MKITEFVKYGYNSTTYTLVNKASDIVNSVFLFINLVFVRGIQNIGYEGKVHAVYTVLPKQDDRKLCIAFNFVRCATKVLEKSINILLEFLVAVI